MNKNIFGKYIDNLIDDKPRVCIQLGSGLDTFVEKISNQIVIEYKDLPNFHSTSITGHKGQFIFGYINDIPILCARGRFHYYEGFSFEEIGSIINIFNFFNPNLCLITNSSGCLNINWEIGNFMLINEFLDFSFINSINIERYKIKIDRYYDTCIEVAKNIGVVLYEGTYAFTTGPSYETKSEIKEIISLKGSAVGMSTFPEYNQCKFLKMNALFISCLTNYGAGLIDGKIDHIDVLSNADKAKNKFCHLITKIIEKIESRKKLKKL